MKLQKMMFAAVAVLAIVCAGCKDSEDAGSIRIPAYLRVDGTEIVDWRADIPAEVSIPDGITAINDNAFYDCDRIHSVFVPRSVTYIAEKAFYSCGSLESITIGDGVTYIGEYAFANCPDLKDVYYNGDLEQWRAVEKYNKPFGYSRYDRGTSYYYTKERDVTIHCTDGDTIE
ncbi:MAG: leucine-rich repeat domain-containing protein [Treponemataceae bacterium]|nr:leucine-rich repeat domain-containing protein [Treponemataceae bacterium]